MTRLPLVAILLGICALPIPPAWAWGPAGHRIVGEIAWERLDPDARKMVRDWMPQAEFGSLARTADWADTVARGNPEYDWALELHYVNVLPSAERYDAARDCPDGRCIVEAIRRYRDELTAARSGDPDADPVLALRFLSHFVGDLHQPLHVGHPDGKGGNKTFVLFFGEVRNLHRVWDSGWLDRAIAALPGRRRDWRAYARTLAKRSRSAEIDVEFSPEEWADESWALAREWTFDVPDSLGPADLEAVRPLVDRQLLRAGHRLAAALNAIAAEPVVDPCGEPAGR